MTDARLIDCDVWIAMNESGKYCVMTTADEARDHLIFMSGGVSIRTVKIVVSMSPPDIDGATVRVPDTAGELQAAAE